MFKIFAGVVALLAAPASVAIADCASPTIGSAEAPMVSPPTMDEVTGAGRLPFYSAPSFNCPLSGVFVIPKDDVAEYARTRDGWSSVMYSPKAADPVFGWVRAARLKILVDLGPKQ